jgi:hypothetical protein
VKAGRHATWTAVVVFVASVAAPGSGVHVHRHAGGELAHVHPDEVLDAERPDHHHDHDPPHAAPDRAGRPILTDDDDAPAHAHVRPPFQRALPFVLAPAIALVAAPLRAPLRLVAPPERQLQAVRSRGPPPVARG